MRFTREQLQLLSDVLWTHQDEGPPGAGWASGALSKLRAEVDTALAEPEPEGPTMFKPDGVHPFVVRHYTDDERPSIKGNGFDGLEVGEDRQEAEEFIAWINARLCPSRSN